MELIWAVPIASIISVIFAIWLAYDVLRRDRGTEQMQEIAGMIFEGATAFLNRQYRTIAILAIVAAIVIGAIVGYFSSDTTLGIKTSAAFLVGAICSGLSGFVGMYIAVQANGRAASAARSSLEEALKVSLRGGAVSGFLVVALSLIGVGAMLLIYGGTNLTPENSVAVVSSIVGFGFGASFVALFAQLGGGIFTKAADVGADLVGKVEQGIPEDDPRNAAVIADLVGDNVGDCAGRGADLFESTAAENIGAMILGASLAVATNNLAWVLFPLIVRAFGLVASIVGIFLARGANPDNPMSALNKGYYVITGLSIIFMFVSVHYLLEDLMFFWAGTVGILTSLAFVYITQYYTSGNWRPVKEIAEASRTGPATNIISGFALGLETTATSVLAIVLALGLSFWLGTMAEVEGVSSSVKGIYATAVATMGMLMSAAYVLSMDTFGPITDNAGGITAMSDAPEEARAITDQLDSVGNTTKALTKGYAIGSAGLAAFLLFQAFLDEVRFELNLPHEAVQVDLVKVEVFIGGFIGAMVVFLFSSLAIRAVGRAASDIIEEVRRQFAENPGIMEGTVRPDYARCVDITTRSALRQMILPGVLAISAPIIVGVALRWEAEAAFLMVGTMSGIILATVLNNGGGAWDNAKKYIEAGNLKDADGNVIGKNSVAHLAAVVGDTVGDPLKDTAGPSLHVLIKLFSTITLVLAPLFI